MENNGISFFFETSAKNGDNIDKVKTEINVKKYLLFDKGF